MTYAHTHSLTHTLSHTGILHDTWDDGMTGTHGMEDSYSFGSTPVREDNSPLATVGLLASVPSRLFPGRVFGRGDAHSYFKNAVMPFMGDAKRPVHHVDNKLFQQAREEKQEAIAAEKVCVHVCVCVFVCAVPAGEAGEAGGDCC